MESLGAYDFVQHVVVDGGAGVSSVSVDPYEELIWMGGGAVSIQPVYHQIQKRI